ncbi:hypothetical protein [Pseudomonas sp. GV071]|jgi:hypothetical protein|uniref:hypothetical protein n=1 Tax=Pseudomonas sp. GV071 TaxID=2135754 RepID=UPI000D39AD84|nr:hypothetical protein [Pseudomonas sp. GV071]PTQ68153.1 hypothetical protein C8K61_11269 [Pseudomonas sp. GV071]
MNAPRTEAWGAQPPLFVQLLGAEVARSTITATGKRIGMSRSAISLVLANRYPSPSTAGVERRVLAVLGRIECLVVGEGITADECQRYRDKPAPTHNPQAMQKWKACLHCHFNPDCQEATASRLH